MTRRTLRVAGFIAGLLLALYLLPMLPPVRAWLLGFAQSAAQNAGYEVSFEGSAGNLWHHLRLSGVRVVGPGVDAELDTLAIFYTLPALVTGTLPLSLETSGVRGEIAVDELSAALTPDTPEPADAPPRRGFRVQPLLRSAEVADVALNVGGVPVDLGDLALRDLHVEQRGEQLDFRGALTADGESAEVRGQAALSPFNLEAEVRADVALARPFFDGLAGGELTGTVRADEAGVTGDLELSGGEVSLVGLELSDVGGLVRLSDQTLQTELTGRALGGPLTGTATVDLGAQRWQAEITGDAALSEAALWLSEGRVPLAPEALQELLGVSGRANVTLRAEGWQTFTLSGLARGEGELRGEPLRNLEVDFGFDTGVGTRAAARADLGDKGLSNADLADTGSGGAPFSFSLSPAGEGFRVQADGTGLPLADGIATDLTLDLKGQGGALSGSAELGLAGELLERGVGLELRARSAGDGWRLELAGSDEQGAQASGEAVVQGGEVTGELSLRGLTHPTLNAPLGARLSADGPLAALPLRLDLSLPEGLTGAGVTVTNDLSGEASATLQGTRLEDLAGQFGPLALSGALDLGERDGLLAYTLAPTRLAGRVAGELAVREGALRLTEGQLETSGTVRSEGVRGAGVQFPDLEAPFELSRALSQESLTARLEDPEQGFAASLEAGVLRGTFAGTPLGALGETFSLDGTLRAELGALELGAADLSAPEGDAPPGALELDLRATAPGTRLSAVGDAESVALTLQSGAGATLAGRTLARPLTLAGEASVQGRRAALAGTLGELAVSLDARPDADGNLEAEARLTGSDETLRAAFSGGSWQTDGALPLASLGEALGLPLAGTLRSDLKDQSGTLSGEAVFEGELFGVPLSGRAQGAGDALAFSADATLLGEPLSLSGRTRLGAGAPLEALVQLGELGVVNVRGEAGTLRVKGQGQLPDLERAGVQVAPQPWRVQGDLGAGRLALEVGDSSFQANRAEDGWTYRGSVQQLAQGFIPGQAEGVPLVLQATVQGEARGEGASYLGEGSLSVAGQAVPLQFSGQGGALRGAAQLDGLALERFTPLSGTASGEVQVDTAQGPLYRVDLSAIGSAFGVPFDLSLGADPEGGLRASGEAAGSAFTLSGALPASDFELTLANEAASFTLDASLALADGAQLTGSGAYGGEPLGLEATFSPEAGGGAPGGTLSATLGDAVLEATLVQELERAGARRVVASLRAPSGLPSAAQFLSAEALNAEALSAEVQLVQESNPEGGSTLRLERLHAEAAQNALELSGTVALGEGEPRADLSGSLTLSAADALTDAPIALRLSPLETGHLAALTLDTLELRAVLSPTFVPQRVRLEGELARPQTTLESDLVWQEGVGFAGAASLNATFQGPSSAPRGTETARARLTLTGEETLGGTLGVLGSASYGGAGVAELAASLSADPWRDRSLSGTLELGAPLHDLLPLWVGDPLTLAGQLGLGGSLDDPQLAGALTLAGAITASGRLELDRQGAEVSLAGDGLSIAASSAWEGYAATVSADALDLSGVLPQLPAPTLSAGLRASQRFGEGPLVQISDVQLASGQSVLSGRARFDAQPSATLLLDAHLSDLNPALQGRLSGPLTLGAPITASPEADGGDLTATLQLEDAGLAAGDWTLAGALNASGSLTDPVLRAQLTGAGAAEGSLLAEVAPRRGAFELFSDLRVAGLQSELSVARGLAGDAPQSLLSQTAAQSPVTQTPVAQTPSSTAPEAPFTAEGTLSYGDFGVTLRGDGGRLVLDGAAQLSGWRAELAPTTTFSLEGPLLSLNPQLAGRVGLTGTLRAGEAAGTVSGLAVAGLELGDLGVAVTGSQVTLAGELLDATATLSGALPWRLERLDLSLPGGLALSATGSGTRQEGELGGVLERAEAPPAAATSAGTENTGNEPLSLPLRAFYSPGGFGVSAQGEGAFEALEVQAHYSGEAWKGGATLQGPLELHSTLSGPLLNPRLEGRLATPAEASAPVTLASTFSLSPEAATFTAEVDAPVLSTPLSVAGRGWPLALELQTPDGEVLGLNVAGGDVQSRGALTLGVGPAELHLTGGEGAGTSAGISVRLSAPAAPGLALSTTLPQALSAWAALPQRVVFEGVDDTAGTLVVRPGARGADADALRWAGAAGTLSLDGRVGTAPSGFSGGFTGGWQGAAGAPLPWLETLQLPFTLDVQEDTFTLSSDGEAGPVFAQLELGERGARLETDLALGGGRVQLGASYTLEGGPQGEMVLSSLPVAQVGEQEARLSGQFGLGAQGARGQGELELGSGRLDVTGELGWRRALPEALTARFLPGADDTLSAQLRLERFDLAGVPWLERQLPYLEAPVSGVAQIRPNQVVGQLLAPDVRAGPTPLPSQLEFNGTFARLEARASVGSSRLNLVYDATDPAGAVVSGLVTLEQFPLNAFAEAAIGQAQVIGSATAAARFEVPLAALSESYVQVASERLTLRRASTAAPVEASLESESGPMTDGATRGPVTEGDVALRYENGSLIVERAEFRGDGFWRAEGRLTPRDLDFTLEAQDADFTPLLSLVPALAAFEVGANGSLDLRASGSLSAPNITFGSPALEISVAGSSYRAVDTQASLSAGAFGLTSELIGVAPVRGALALRGSGQVSLSPFIASGVALRFTGGAVIPTVGAVTDIVGRIFPSEGLRDWQLEAGGVLGNPLTITGALAPLDLTLQGQGLDVRSERLFLASSNTDVNLNLTAAEGQFTLTGSAFARTAQLSLARQGEGATTPGSGDLPSSPEPEPNPPQDTDTLPQEAAVPNGSVENGPMRNTRDAEAPFAGGLGSVPSIGGSAALDIPAPAALPTPDADIDIDTSTGTDAAMSGAASAAPDAPGRSTPNPVLQRVRFDDVTVRAPREVVFQSGFGNAELGLELTLSGSAAEPLLEGQARTLRGTVRFSGQDFVLTQAVADFDPAQGAFPTLSLEARASFEKARALGTQAIGTQASSIALPPGPTFDMLLSVTGGFEENPSGRPTLELEPTLSSNAQIQETGAPAPRPLSEAELVSLLTLGRLQLGAPLTDVGGVAGSVAESALDTAVDLLVLSELQSALGEAFGVDLFEIRTSSLSTILDGQLSDPFGVSVRVGGYLNDNLFASVQVGRFDDPDQSYALSNEFSLRYTLDPLTLNLSGGVNLQGRTTLTAVTDFNLALGYNISPLISLDAALETSAQSQGARVGFGVSFTW